MMWTRHARAAFGVVLIVAAGASAAGAQSAHRLTIRGHDQLLQLYGPPAGDPVIVSSGDGGWVHLGPHVARVLAARVAIAGGRLDEAMSAITELDPSLLFVEVLVGENHEAEFLRVKLHRFVLIADRNADELDAFDHQCLRAR